jgi:hypothetical protein
VGEEGGVKQRMKRKERFREFRLSK